MKKKVIVLILAIVVVATTAYIAIAAYGGVDDPLVTLSYINSDVVPSILQQVDTKLSENQDELKQTIKDEILAEIGDGSITAGSSEFVPVQLKQGQTICASTGSIEVLLRRGTFTCVDPTGEKITNVTKGGEAGNGGILTLQNLYLIPRADGRGITATSIEAWVMVRGAYTIQ